MRHVQFRESGRVRPGVLVGDRVIDNEAAGYPTLLSAWLALSPQAAQRLQRDTERDAARDATGIWPLCAVRLEAPLPRPSKIIAVGLNYLDHCREQKVDPPTQPLVFSKFPTTLIGPFDEITWDDALTREVDPEVELGVVIGTGGRAIPVERALDHVFGYTVVNDVSARDLQFGDGQWTRGKSLDTFCPVGPAVVTADEIPDPQALRLTLEVDGAVRQDSSTREMIFSVAEIISHVSTFATLEPGDLLLTGTPWGVGCFRSPPVYLRGGETVRCRIESIGEIANPTHIREVRAS